MATKAARKPKEKAPAGTLLLLVRHGQTPSTGQVLPGRAKGLHLSEAGQAEATAAAERIAPFADRIGAVYASPLERTRETAAPIGKPFAVRHFHHTVTQEFSTTFGNAISAKGFIYGGGVLKANVWRLTLPH